MSASTAEPASSERGLAHAGSIVKKTQKAQHIADTRMTRRLREQSILSPERAAHVNKSLTLF
jgi:hypothetical protein